MTAEYAIEFAPDYAIAPGETLLELLQMHGLTQAELSERTGRPKKTINEIINAKAAITPETALQLERVLGVAASFWNAREQQYRAALARQAERAVLEREISWLKEIPLADLIRLGWVPKCRDRVEQLASTLSFYGVASVDVWRAVWGSLEQRVAFRRSEQYAIEMAAMAAWLRKGELDARTLTTRPYDGAAFRHVLSELRTVTRTESVDAFTTAVSRCASVGVALCFVPALPRLRVCGAARWLTPEKALIQLSLRYKSNDQIWFTFFHEAAHLLLHGKRAIFVDEEAAASRDGPARDAEETEANRFAQELLIPSREFEAFVGAERFDEANIRQFASEIGIAPGIVLGRLQREELVPFSSSLNRTLKQRYEFL